MDLDSTKEQSGTTACETPEYNYGNNAEKDSDRVGVILSTR